jgi:hypothetical protein
MVQTVATFPLRFTVPPNAAGDTAASANPSDAIKFFIVAPKAPLVISVKMK